MAVAAVTSPDPFTFPPHVSPSVAAPGDVDGDEFEFRVPAAAAALSVADELFCGGKLVPLRPPPQPVSPPCSPAPCLEVELASEPRSPRAPRCAGRRWRDLLLLLVTKKAKGGGNGDDEKCANGCLKRPEIHFRPLLSRDSSSSSSTSSVDSGQNARGPPPKSCSPLRTRSAPVANLLHLMSRRPAGDKTVGATDSPPKRQEACAHPLLNLASSSSSSSAFPSDPYTRNPRAPWRPGAPARPRPAVAAETPRVSASGRVLFRGLERCSSTPASAGTGPLRRPRPRGMERSYSANVRVDPVINVFGFGHLFMPSSPAKEKNADRERDGGGRRNKPHKLAMVLRDPHD